MKKTISGILSLALLISALALPAVATAPNDGIEPHIAVWDCPKCYGDCKVHETVKIRYVPVGMCCQATFPHNHREERKVFIYDCPKCGVTEVWGDMLNEECWAWE